MMFLSSGLMTQMLILSNPIQVFPSPMLHLQYTSKKCLTLVEAKRKRKGEWGRGWGNNDKHLDFLSFYFHDLEHDSEGQHKAIKITDHNMKL